MIRDLRKLNRGGHYIADYRADEGIRVREDAISPTLTSHTGGGISHEILLIEVTEIESKE